MGGHLHPNWTCSLPSFFDQLITILLMCDLKLTQILLTFTTSFLILTAVSFNVCCVTAIMMNINVLFLTSDSTLLEIGKIETMLFIQMSCVT